MASGISKSLERDNFSRLGQGVVQVGSSIARDTVESFIPSRLLYTIVNPSHPVWKRLNDHQKNLVKNSGRDGYKYFDITLCYTLLRNVCTNLNSPNKLVPPIGGWGNDPLPYNHTIGDDIERLRLLRNSMHGHRAQATISDAEYQVHWQQLKDICSRMQTYLNKQYLTELSQLETYKLNELDIKSLIDELGEIKEEIKQMSKLSDIQEISDEKINEFNSLLQKLNNEETQRVVLAPLQQSSIIPIDLIYVPVSIRKDLEDRLKEHHTTEDTSEPELVNGPEDVFLKNGQQTRFVMLQGEAGRGKSVYCLQLMKYWCSAKKHGANKDELSDWQNSLNEFDFLFLVRLRDVEKSSVSLTEMICENIEFMGYSGYQETICNVLSSDKYRCLLIIDGLDEWIVSDDVSSQLKYSCIPNIKNISCSTFLFTMRPWRFEAVAHLIRNRDRVIEIQGFNNEGIKTLTHKILINHFHVAKSSPKFKDHLKDIKERANDNKFKSILRVPLLAIVSFMLWFQKKTVGNCMTTFYIALVRMLIERAIENETVDKKIHEKLSKSRKDLTIPQLLQNDNILNDFINVLYTLGDVALTDLTSRETHLVFEKREIEKKLGELELHFALKVGLLTHSEANGPAHAKCVRISFFHKTVQEFLAAMHISCKKELSEIFLDYLSSIEAIMEFENVIMFVSGMSPSLGEILSHHIVNVANTDPDIRRYRDSFHYKLLNKVNLLYKMQLSCLKEMAETEKDASRQNCRISDVLINRHSDPDIVRLTADFLCHNNTSIVSLYMNRVSNDRQHGITDTEVNSFLQQTTGLQSLFIDGYNSNRTLHAINTITSLTALVLYNLSITPSLLHDIQTSLHNDTHIHRLGLVYIRCVESDEVRHKATGDALPSLKDRAPEAKMSFCSLLNNLPKCRHLTKLNISYMLDIEERDMLLKVLPHLSHLRVIKYYGSTACPGVDDGEYDYMIVRMVSQWTQLHRLLLGYISLGDRPLKFNAAMADLEQIVFDRVKMSAEGWGKLITSFTSIQRQFDIELWGTDISADCVMMIRSSPNFTVTRHDEGRNFLFFTKKFSPIVQAPAEQSDDVTDAAIST